MHGWKICRIGTGQALKLNKCVCVKLFYSGLTYHISIEGKLIWQLSTKVAVHVSVYFNSKMVKKIKSKAILAFDELTH